MWALCWLRVLVACSFLIIIISSQSSSEKSVTLQKYVGNTECATEFLDSHNTYSTNVCLMNWDQETRQIHYEKFFCASGRASHTLYKDDTCTVVHHDELRDFSSVGRCVPLSTQQASYIMKCAHRRARSAPKAPPEPSEGPYEGLAGLPPEVIVHQETWLAAMLRILSDTVPLALGFLCTAGVAWTVAARGHEPPDDSTAGSTEKATRKARVGGQSPQAPKTVFIVSGAHGALLPKGCSQCPPCLAAAFPPPQYSLEALTMGGLRRRWVEEEGSGCSCVCDVLLVLCDTLSSAELACIGDTAGPNTYTAGPNTYKLAYSTHCTEHEAGSLLRDRHLDAAVLPRGTPPCVVLPEGGTLPLPTGLDAQAAAIARLVQAGVTRFTIEAMGTMPEEDVQAQESAQLLLGLALNGSLLQLRGAQEPSRLQAGYVSHRCSAGTSTTIPFYVSLPSGALMLAETNVVRRHVRCWPPLQGSGTIAEAMLAMRHTLGVDAHALLYRALPWCCAIMHFNTPQEAVFVPDFTTSSVFPTGSMEAVSEILVAHAVAQHHGFPEGTPCIVELLHQGFAVLLGAHGAQQLEMAWQHCTEALMAGLPFGASAMSWNSWDRASLHPVLVRDETRICIGGVLIQAPGTVDGAPCTVARVLCSPKMLKSAHVKARVLAELRQRGAHLLATRLQIQTSQVWDFPESEVSDNQFLLVEDVGSDLVLMKPCEMETQICECFYCAAPSLPVDLSSTATDKLLMAELTRRPRR